MCRSLSTLSRCLNGSLLPVFPVFTRVLLGFQCLRDWHRPAIRMDESARHIWHVLLAHPNRYHSVGASVTSWQSRQLHDVVVHVSWDNSLWGARGEVRYAALAETEAEVTELMHAYPLRSTLQESWAQLSGTDEGTSEGELWRVSVSQSHWTSSGWKWVQCCNVSGWRKCNLKKKRKPHLMYRFAICLLQCKYSTSSFSIFHVFRRRLRLHLIKAWRSLKGQHFVMPPST